MIAYGAIQADQPQPRQQRGRVALQQSHSLPDRARDPYYRALGSQRAGNYHADSRRFPLIAEGRSKVVLSLARPDPDFFNASPGSSLCRPFGDQAVHCYREPCGCSRNVQARTKEARGPLMNLRTAQVSA